MAEAKVDEIIIEMQLEVHDHDLTAALAGGHLRRRKPKLQASPWQTRACLALARTLRLPALTADRNWLGVADAVGVRVDIIR